MRNVFYKKMTSEITEIKLTESGFSINEPFGAKPKLFDWEEINSVQFSENWNEVIFEKAEKKSVWKVTTLVGMNLFKMYQQDLKNLILTMYLNLWIP